MKRSGFFLSICLTIAPVSLSSQDLNQVTLSGYVTNKDTGNPLAGVLVEVINEADTSQKSNGQTDVTGRYHLNLAVGIERQPANSVPSEYILDQNYPNPFNPSTSIRFQVPRSGQVRLEIYNMLGQKIRTLVDGEYAPGIYSVLWDAADDAGEGVAAGLYFYRLQAGEATLTRKMLLLDGGVGTRSISPTNIQSKLESPETGLQKSNILTVSIRATSARTQRFEMQHVNITENDFRFNIEVSVISTSDLNRDLILLSESNTEGRVFISGLVDAVKDPECRIDEITILNQRTRGKIVARLEYDGSIPLMSIEGAAGDQLSATLSYEGKQVGNIETFGVGDRVPPTVLRAKPTNGDKDIIIDAYIRIEFSEPIDINTFESNFTLSGPNGIVDGFITFSQENTVATFSPYQPMAPNTEYTIQLSQNLTDLQGNNLQSPFIAVFTTGPTTAGIETKWKKHVIEPCFSAINDVTVIDLDGDLDLDIVTTADVDLAGYIAWYEAPSWTMHSILNYYPEKICGLSVTDLDSDDDLDIIVSESDFGKNFIVWFAAPNWTKKIITENIDGALDLKIVDMNNDGNLDIVTAGFSAGNVVWYESPSWTRHIVDGNLAGARKVYPIDFDGDNDVDIVATGTNANQVVWYEAPSWTKHIIDDNLPLAEGLDVVDMDEDRDLDILATGFQEADIVWYEAPFWTRHVITSNLDHAFNAKAADLDGDGDKDIVFADYWKNYVAFFEAPHWIMHILDQELETAYDVCVSDIDGDGDADIVASARSAYSILHDIVWYERVSE